MPCESLPCGKDSPRPAPGPPVADLASGGTRGSHPARDRDVAGLVRPCAQIDTALLGNCALVRFIIFFRGPITKIIPSDGCKGDTVPLAVGRWYDFHDLGAIWGMSA